MEQKNLLGGLKRSLDEISEGEVVLLQHPRQGKSLSAIFEFIEMISKSVEEGPRQSVKKVAIILGENSERNLKIVDIPEIQKSFDYQSGKRKGKYSKYHNNKHYNNKLHK